MYVMQDGLCFQRSLWVCSACAPDCCQ